MHQGREGEREGLRLVCGSVRGCAPRLSPDHYLKQSHACKQQRGSRVRVRGLRGSWLREFLRLTMVLVCADPCLAHAHAHVRDAGRYDTTVGAAGDEWYYIFGSSSNVTVIRSTNLKVSAHGMSSGGIAPEIRKIIYALRPVRISCWLHHAADKQVGCRSHRPPRRCQLDGPSAFSWRWCRQRNGRDPKG